MFEKLATLAIAVYVGWMLTSGRTLCWSDRHHPNFFALKSRWVYRDEEPGLYWGLITFHVIVVAILASMAFLK